MSEEKTYTKEEMEFRERFARQEQQIERFKERIDSLEVALKCHSHKNSERAMFEYIQ